MGLFVSCGFSIAQSDQLYGFYPSALVKRDLGERLGISVGLSSEMNAISRTLDGREFPAEVLNFNIETALAFDLHPNVHLAAGFLYRSREPLTEATSELRPWQQVTTVHRINTLRFRNRLRFEQRLTEAPMSGSRDLDLRLRYRLSMDTPLEGERLDAREFYLNVSTEALVTTTADRPFRSWESRTYAGVGYRFDNGARLEPGLEFRSRHAGEIGRRNMLYFRLTWVGKLRKRTT